MAVNSFNAQNPPVNTKGDLFTFSTIPTRLAVGANDTVLTADSSTATGLKWGTVSAGGWTQIATGTLSGATVSITGISGSYQDLVLVIFNYRPAVDGDNLRLRFNQDSNANRHISRSDAAVYGQAFNATSAQILGATDSTTNDGFGITTIYQYAKTGTWKFLTSLLIENNDTTTTQADFDRRLGIYNQTGAITSFDLFAPSGNMSAGTYYLYGVK